MDPPKTKFLNQNDVKVYNCTFELQLFELRIFLRFPCKFFVEWKTNSAHKLAKTQNLVENFNGKVQFNQKLILNVQMLLDTSKNTWIKKDSTISVYLITKNKPNFNQLAGRINIDFSTVCQANPYQKPSIQSLTYSSASADLKFSLNLKQSLISKKTVFEVDLHEFNEKLSFTNQNEQLKKSKSIDYIKNIEQGASPVYQIPQSPTSISQRPKSIKPFHFPISKLESYGLQIHQTIKQDDEPETQFNARMTLGKHKNPMAKNYYNKMIEEQTKGMKKSNLMVVPDMKKNRVEKDEFEELNSDHYNKADEYQKQINDAVRNQPLKKIGSDSQLYRQSKSPEQSVIDIVVDFSEPPQSKENIEFNQKNLKNSIDSNNSFSISRFRAQFQGSEGLGFSKSKELIDPKSQLQMPIVLKKQISSNDSKGDIYKISLKYQASKYRIKELQTDVSDLVKMLTDTREKIQKIQEQKKKTIILLEESTFDNAQLQKKLDELQQKANYDSRINQITCQKLKSVNSQLSQQKRRASRSQDQLPDLVSFSVQIKNLKEYVHKLSFEKASLEEKLFRRDQIELQNQIRIQELEEELSRYRTLKLDSAPKVSPSLLQLESKIVLGQKISENELKQKEHISFLEQKLQKIEKQNVKFKDMCNEAYKNVEMYSERDQRMKKNVLIAENQFEAVVKLLVEREKLLKEKIMQLQVLKRRSPSSVFGLSAAQQIKNKGLEQEVKKKDQMLEFYYNQIRLLEDQLSRTQFHNKQLVELHRNNFRESINFQGDLKVIKEEESYRESLASSGESFRLSFASSKLTVKEENAVAKYKNAVKEYFGKQNVNQNFDIEFTVDIHDFRWKAFEELERSAKIITDLMKKNDKIQAKLDQFQEQQRVSAGSSNISPFSGHPSSKPSQEQISDKYSEATKRRSPISMNNQQRLSHEVEKLKSLLYDKSKEMNDLIASYEKLRLEKETQAMVMKNKSVRIKSKMINNGEQSDTELVHDLLDLQIRLSKQKQHKNQIMSELSIQKSLNKSQQISQYGQCDIAQTYKQIRSIILSRQNFITTEESLNRLVGRINQLERGADRIEKDSKLMFVVEEKARSISKEIQVMKSALFKMNFKQIQPYQYKTTFATILRPCQTALNQLLVSVQSMINAFA